MGELDKYQKNFSENLKYYMELKGIKQQDIVDDLGVCSASISYWCSGQRIPRMDKVQLLADYLKVKPSDLLADREIDIVKDELFEKRKLLFDISNKATEQDLDEIIKVVNAIVETGTAADAYVRRVEMPMSVRGFTVKDKDGLYNIYLNDKLSPEAERKTLQHEVGHIVNGDFEKDDQGHILD